MSDKCEAKQYSDTMKCDRCELVWDTNDANPPMCKKFKSTPKIKPVTPAPIDANMNVPGYEDLARIVKSAYDQSARGKGKERHANDKPFHQQPIMEIGRMVGVGGHSYQICKKAQEATGMVNRQNYDVAIAEFRGVIVYAAAAILLVEGMKPDDK